MKPSEIILRHLLKANCATYEELKRLLEQNNYKPDGVYEYVKHLKRKNYVHCLRMAKKKVVCINENVRREITVILKALERV